MSRRRWTSADLERLERRRAGTSFQEVEAKWKESKGPSVHEQLATQHDPLEGATQLERRYAAWLDQEQAAGRVVAWRYEPLRLVLSRGGRGRKGLTYAPDFWVLRRDCVCCGASGRVRSVRLNSEAEVEVIRESECAACGGKTWADLYKRLELVEVKPRRRDSTEPLWLGDSRTKCLAAAEWLRWSGVPLVLVLPNKDGTWERRQM